MTGDGGLVPVTLVVDAGTVRRGDEILMGGQVLTVRDLRAVGRGGRFLEFASGETFTMRPSTVLWATRRVSPRVRA
ncbi:hypothetical protein RM780_08230 [Streptomyces sp. DSM 44917]|uniref:Uncharacterized protein n=1 Tax=Streptomyces boetiae TaxID=3075541 RepID=A0ABU2L5W0_9ACTN|nr:hypothetical protein [Streptomyces sp. DSM 44917]MDT0306950.1 hypothetical protein [Streptomyces sp. DSM 44917]